MLAAVILALVALAICMRDLRLVRGRLAAHARRRRPHPAPSLGPGRAPDRAPVGLPPRRAAVAWEPRERGGRRVGRRASTRPRLRHRRPRLASAGRAAPPKAACLARSPVRRARQPRHRGDARPVLPGGGAPRSRARDAARRRRGHGGHPTGWRCRSSASTPRRTAGARRGRTSSSTRRAPFGCSSAISPASCSGSATARST